MDAKFTLTKNQFRLTLVAGLLLSLLGTIWPRKAAPDYYLEVTIRSAVAGIGELYYHVGDGGQNIDSSKLTIDRGSHDETHRFRLPAGRYRQLRFDPSDKDDNEMALSNARIIEAPHRLVRSIDLSQFRVAQQIDRLQLVGGELHFITTKGNDSAFAIDLQEPLTLSAYPPASWRKLAWRFARFLLPSLLLSYVSVISVSRKKTFKAKPWLVTRKAWLAAHPTLLISFVAAVFVLLSCYPVVFFGKSFVSPNNHSHTYLLYGEMPTVPGYADAMTDDEKGSDLGAMMWYSWPTSVVESRALFRDFELPLWNRYDSAGVPLLGQGQSMFGDPLHFLVLLGRGASSWWDLKFVLAKFLFALTLGLAVFQITRYLPAATAIAASSAFIGFFSYRYAHPAFFSMCYAPAVLLCWLKLLDSRRGSVTAGWLAGLVLADWTLMNSGTVKEAYILVLGMNAAGALTLWLAPGVADKSRRILQSLFASLLFLLLSTPIWLTFLHTLQRSWTSYDAGGVWQLQPSLLVGLFDDIFYRQFTLGENHLDPSANFFVLLGLLWFFASPRHFEGNALPRGILIVLFASLAFVFGVIPPSWILRIPFLNRILHIDNTFSCVAIICMLLLAGIGLKVMFADIGATTFRRTYCRVVLLFGVLLAFYFGATHAAQRSAVTLLKMGEEIPKSSFFSGYALTLVAAVLFLPLLLRTMLGAARVRWLSAMLLLAAFFLLHWRNGMHLTTPFDPYVMNPRERVKLVSESSPTLSYIANHSPEPFRVAGLGHNLTPGYGGAVEAEEIDGPDPLVNSYYAHFVWASGLTLPFEVARPGVLDDDLAQGLPILDMLNVRYYLADIGTKFDSLSKLTKVASADLDLYQSEHVWPRAFFVDKLVTYEREDNFIELLKGGDGRPFAAISESDAATSKQLSQLVVPRASLSSRRVTEVHSYNLTTNTTTLQITAPSAGLLVLTEPFANDDFHVTVNEKHVSYFRVNSAFKAVLLPAAGEYRVSFSYWPANMTASLIISAVALVLLVAWLTQVARSAIPVATTVAAPREGRGILVR